VAIKNQSVLAVIPARGGSKRCPRKNIRDFRGKPLIAWTIKAASESKYIDLIVVSSEDQEIKSKVRDYLPIDPKSIVVHRPHDLANDLAMNEDVMRHAHKLRPNYDWIVLLQPSSPLRTAQDIDKCLEIAQSDMGCVSYRKNGTKNGAVYVARAGWLENNNFDIPFEVYYTMPDERSLDIDWPEEFNL
jgi:CMP-N,N'-diacetyllegionaminic acid synthase